MAKTISKIPLLAPHDMRNKRVAAYARVSVDNDRLLHSLSAQVSYYKAQILHTPGWDFAGIYVDQGITGTKMQARKEFLRMLADCEAGKIDIILTKSVSRFARNTLDTLNVVRHLKSLGIEIRFEKENIHTLNSDGELLITLLSSFAQEESRSISENIKWSIRKRFEKGDFYTHSRLLGYRWENDQIVIVPEEADIVRRIFNDCIAGIGFMQMERDYAAEGFLSINSKPLKAATLRMILNNVMYTGNQELQKSFIEDPISKKKRKNNGQLPKYFVEGTHEAIISQETFDLAQKELARRKEIRLSTQKPVTHTCFSGKIKCSCHGCSFVKNKHSTPSPDKETPLYWACSLTKKGVHCDAKLIPDQILRKVCAKALKLESFDEAVFLNKVKQINATGNRHLQFIFKNGATWETDWEPGSHRDYWTPENRAKMVLLHSDPSLRKPGKYDFSCYLVCKCCGRNYAAQLSKKHGYEREVNWYCHHEQSDCHHFFLTDSMLHQTVSEALDMHPFDTETFRESVRRILIQSETEMEIIRKDGSTILCPIWPGYTKPIVKEIIHAEESNNDTGDPVEIYRAANY